MPTKRPRHMVTETEPVREALDELRSELGEERIELPELVIRGAREKTRELRARSQSVRNARIRLARAIRDGGGLDPDAARLADEAKQIGLSAEI